MSSRLFCSRASLFISLATLAMSGCVGSAEDEESDDARYAAAGEDSEGESEIGGKLQAATGRFVARNCTPGQQPEVQLAVDRAMTLLQSSRSDAKFTRWFGVSPTQSQWTDFKNAAKYINTFMQESLSLLGAAARETPRA